MQQSNDSRAFRSGLCLAVVLVLLTSCNRNAIDRFPIAGTIMFSGKPVEYGSIAFEPHASVGAMAPSSYAPVENGVYETKPGESPTRGRYSVRVYGFDKARMKTDVPAGTPIVTPELFPVYETEVDVPTPDGRFDIDVPMHRAKKGQKKP